MTRIVKTIRGRKYAYAVKWDREKKKQVWTYQGRVQDKIDPDTLKGELYLAIKRHLRTQKEDRKEIMRAINEVLAKYEWCW
jgi:hypothetical protein